MRYAVSKEDVLEAVVHLRRTQRGRSAMRHVLHWLDDDGLGLDLGNQEAILAVLDGAWGEWSGSARDYMRDALDGDTSHATIANLSLSREDWKAFDQLTRRLVRVPKEELDRAEAKRKKRKRSK